MNKLIVSPSPHDENYVKTVVGYYRRLLDKFSDKSSSGKSMLYFEPNINKVFNRGFTSYFLTDREACYNFDSPKFIGERIGKITKVYDKYFEIKLNSKVILNNQDGLNFDKKGELGCLVNKIVNNKVFPNKFDILCKLKEGMPIYRNTDTVFEKSVEKSNSKRQIGVKITYSDYKITVVDEDNNTVSLDVSEREIPQNTNKMKDNFIKSLSKTGDADFYIFDNIDIKSDLPFIPVSAVNEYRRRLFEELMFERLKNYIRETQKPLKYADYPIKELDYRANIYNKDAEEFYNNSGAVVKEYAFEKSCPNREVELMRTKHCIKYALNMCKSPKQLYLVNDKGERFKLIFDCKNCEMAILKP